MNKYLTLFLKGIGMGAANVVPGVSGGTIALITGIFEPLIDAIKSFNLTALQLLLKGKFKDFAQHINLYFLLAIFLGVAVSILTLARLFGYLLEYHPVYLYATFFGLILASVYYVGITVEKWNFPVILSFIIGTAIALLLTFLKPASENSSLVYLLICGVVATCSMILPGLSGSFVLVLMGNYQLIMIDAVNELNLSILLPVVVGAAVGLLLFSNFLSWVFKHYKNQTIAMLTGFILGSIGVLWPWKAEQYITDASGEYILNDGEKLVEGYQWLMPDRFSNEVILAIVFMAVGILIIWGTEYLASRKTT
jgi:putative membrane protein